MTTGILLYDKNDYLNNQWFAEQFINLGKAMGLDISLVFTQDFPTDLFKAEFVINRARDSCLAEYLEKDKIRVFNNAKVSAIGNNKISGIEYAKQLKISHPKTCNANKIYEPGFHMTFPLVVKSLAGHGGSEVYLAQNKADVAKLIGKRSINDFLVQEFLAHCTDIRVYMLGTEILGVIERIPHDDFRSNICQGGKSEPFSLPDRIRNLSIRVATSLGADLIGIDFLKNEDGYHFNEIEDVVGTRSLYKNYDIDVVSLYLKYIKSKLEK